MSQPPDGNPIAEPPDFSLAVPCSPTHYCGICKKQFSSQKVLRRHRSTIHDKKAPYSCRYPGCTRFEKRFGRLDNFRQHLRGVHSLTGRELERYLGTKVHSSHGDGDASISTGTGVLAEQLPERNLARELERVRDALRESKKVVEEIQAKMRELEANGKSG